ncbi:hypothetical protein [Floricoccus penangensis]|uniref:hypothetical protein n=1 Tax=Floricoccus penangensis TaxID=1859475 RepID=UPI002042201B|nr:hypothetical protein [Floricoccus penangensis]URZ87206.1 hypothetical protein KIW23_09000 [Floricoccus penangensis]
MMERYIDDMDNFDKQKAKIFFNALHQLDKEQRKVLADKYYHSDIEATYNHSLGRFTTFIPNSDKVLAKRYDMTVNNFGKFRYEIESELYRRYLAFENDMKQNEVENLSRFVLKYRYLYVKEDDTGKYDEILMTTNHEKAKVFTKDKCDLSFSLTNLFEKELTYQDRASLEEWDIKS